MIIDKRIVDFINSYNVMQKDYLEEIRKDAIANEVPIIRREMENFLKVMLTLRQPKRILEIGTAVGYSSLIMSEYMPKGCKIVTIENYAPRIAVAAENFKKAAKEDVIEFIPMDAVEALEQLDEEFDFVFIDAAKGQYSIYLSYVLKMLSAGGIIITDNILCDGDIIESKYAVTRRNRTIHTRMREYLYEITHSEELDTTLIPLGDGVALSVKK